MKKVTYIILGILTLALILAIYTIVGGPHSKKFEYYVDPSLSQMPNQNMLVVEAKGDPNVSGSKAIQLLYKTYYSLKGVSKSFKMASPRARWPISWDTPKEQWVGLFAIPIPEEIKTLPAIKNPDSLNIYIDEWEYGNVAEILHKGSYATEEPTIQRLKDYVKEQGYTIIGEHEEEYIKGPGMFGPGNPDKYLTIIRYKVAKKDSL